ncbi:MAG: hypothetical protein EHM48_08775 [Planctomycetaceae bacterium]|nr:MAG: hypothetical protein EHM48_08775 [Planctomycetaceae bacterium]
MSEAKQPQPQPAGPQPHTQATTPEADFRRRKESPPPKYQPNVVPLIDVLFMLLLFFLLGTKFRQMEGDLPGSLPATATAVQRQDRPEIEVRVKIFGGAVPPKLENGKPVLPADLRYEISGFGTTTSDPNVLFKMLSERRMQGTDKTPVVIEPEAGTCWQYVVEAFNQSKRAKFGVINLWAVQ